MMCSSYLYSGRELIIYTWSGMFDFQFAASHLQRFAGAGSFCSEFPRLFDLSSLEFGHESEVPRLLELCGVAFGGPPIAFVVAPQNHRHFAAAAANARLRCDILRTMGEACSWFAALHPPLTEAAH